MILLGIGIISLAGSTDIAADVDELLGHDLCLYRRFVGVAGEGLLAGETAGL